ncbi:MAG: type II toxin-antitoxin system VapC family toxin [Chloroflexota bacterium]|nr:type II toxin-antitoxin system VapC family toxin [Chloroflexota bacterium]
MKLLLDIHIFLWFISGDERLSEGMRDIIRDLDNKVYLSVVSLWKAIVKYRLGKLPLPQPPDIYLPVQRQRHQVISLPLDEASVSQLASLPKIHRDPFDRMLICQALEHSLTIATVDDTVCAYGSLKNNLVF